MEPIEESGGGETKARVGSASMLPVPDYAAPAIPSTTRRRIQSEKRSSWSNFKVPNTEGDAPIERTPNPLAPFSLLGARGSTASLQPFILAAGVAPEPVGDVSGIPPQATGTEMEEAAPVAVPEVANEDALPEAAAPSPGPPSDAVRRVRSPLSAAEKSLREYRVSTILTASSVQSSTSFQAMQAAFETQLQTLLEQIKSGRVILCSSSADLDTSGYYASAAPDAEGRAEEATPEAEAREEQETGDDVQLNVPGNFYSAAGRSPNAPRSPEDRRESRFTLRRKAKQLLTGAGSRSSSYMDAAAAARAMGGGREMEEVSLPGGASHDLAPVYRAVMKSKKSIVDYARKKSDLPYIKGHAPAAAEGVDKHGASSLKDAERETDVYRCLDAFLCALEAKTGLPSGRIRTLIGSVPFDELQQQVVTLVNQKQKVRLMYTQLSQELAAVQSTLEHVEELSREDERKYSKTQAIRTDTAKQGILSQAKELTNTREIAFLWEVQLDKIFEDCTLKMHKIYSEFLEMHRLVAEEPSSNHETEPNDLRASVARSMGQGGTAMQAVDLSGSGGAIPNSAPVGDPHLQYFLENRGFSQHIPLLCGKNITFSHFSCLADVDLAELGISPAADCLAMHSAILTIPSSANGAKIVKEGWMLKQGDRVKNWKRRYFVLRSSNELMYFRDQGCTRQCGLVDLNKPCSVSKHIVDSDKLQHCFRVNTIGRTWIFSCGNVSERNDWLQLLNNIVNFNRLRATPLPPQ